VSQRNLLPAADRQLLERLEREAQDPAELSRRRRLFDGDLSDFGGNCKRADTAMAALLKPAVGGDLDRCDRLVLFIVWQVVRDQDADYFVPLQAPAAPTPSPPLVEAPAAQVASAVPPQSTRAGSDVPAGHAGPLAPPLRAPCTGAAIEFLRATLAAGERESREVQSEGATCGLTPAMIRAARQRLGIVTEKRGFGSACRSYWGLACEH
jgi:hypothetical protein